MKYPLFPVPILFVSERKIASISLSSGKEMLLGVYPGTTVIKFLSSGEEPLSVSKYGGIFFSHLNSLV